MKANHSSISSLLLSKGLDQISSKIQIESKSQPCNDDVANPIGWIKYLQRYKLKANHSAGVAGDGLIVLDQISSKIQIESKSQHASIGRSSRLLLDQISSKIQIESKSQLGTRCPKSNESWIKYLQRYKLKANHS